MSADYAGLVQSNAAPRAEFAYVDDSGDPGMVNGSATFGLGCVVVPLDHWTTRLDLLVQMRRDIRDTYRIRLRDEVKAEWLVNVKKHFRDQKLGDGQLRDIYHRHLHILPIVSSATFAIVIRKNEIKDRTKDPEAMAWEFLLQRLRMRSRATSAPIMVLHDQGSRDKELRKHVRRFRRHTLNPLGQHAEAPLIVEDPVPRDSQHSYFVQLADLCAYAATRKVIPAGRRRRSVCSEQMWDEVGAARLSEVSNSRSDGIVVWP
jgi:hypothetical protein